MKLEISPEKTLSDIKSAFSQAWPHLKLVFFTKAHEAHAGSNAKFMIDNDTLTLQEVAPKVKGTQGLYIEQETPVWQLERLFEEEYGIHVQVFRKSGSVWLETTVSDDLTLEQQEARGKASDRVIETNIDPIDYREQD
jgi:hypothetical protein